MPSWIKTKQDEAIWRRAKKLIKKQYPYITVGSERFYKLVTALYKKLGGKI